MILLFVHISECDSVNVHTMRPFVGYFEAVVEREL